MRYAVACDHAGLPLKEAAIATLRGLGNEVDDLGVHSAEPSDYPDAARAAANAIRCGRAERAVLICGSGVGAGIAAGKFPGVRAATCHDTYSARQGVEDDDMNVLCLGARVIGPELAIACIRAFAGARYSGAERHERRLAKIHAIEREFAGGPTERTGA